MQMYNDAGKVQVCVGGCSAMLSWISGLSISQDIMPLVSTIGVIAGTLVALHGCLVIVYKWIKHLRERNSNDTWY